MAPLGAVALLVIILLVLLIPIIAILTDHQQKMVKLMREGQPDGRTEAEVRALREEIQELKALVYQQVIAADAGASKTPLQERIQA